MLRAALSGLKVVDFSQIAAGPTCTMLLADLGATVVKVEPPEGDLGRTLGPGWVGKDSALFHALNRNKQGICADLKTPGGQEVARRLIAEADVLIESMRPGVMTRLGLGHEVLCREFPRLVYCSISAYGQQGPYAGRAGVDGILQADTGLMSIIGTPGSEPCKVQTPAVDVVTGYVASTAILARLMQRAATGVGGHLDVNLMNSAIGLQAPAIASYMSDRVLPKRIGSAAPYSAPNEAFETADGWIMVAAYMGDRWQKLCNLLGRPELAQDARFTTSALRIAHRGEMREVLNALFRTHPTDHWLPVLLEQDILCSRIGNYEDLVRHPQVAANRAMATLDIAGYGPLQVPAFPVNSLESAGLPYRTAPSLGADTRSVLRGLGYDEAAIEALLAGGDLQATAPAADGKPTAPPPPPGVPATTA